MDITSPLSLLLNYIRHIPALNPAAQPSLLKAAPFCSWLLINWIYLVGLVVCLDGYIDEKYERKEK